MSRGMHRHRSIRLTNLRATRLETRAANAPAKNKATELRAARHRAALAKATGTDLNPAVKSWVAKQVGKPFTKVTAAEIAALVKG